MHIEYNKNPLRSKIILDNNDKELFKLKVRVHVLEEMLFEGGMYLREGPHFNLDRARKYLSVTYQEDEETTNIDIAAASLFESLMFELEYQHSGDCTCVAMSCGKCWAETILGIDTLKGLGKHSAYKIDAAFGTKNENSLEQALEYLRDYDPKPSEPEKWARVGGYEQYVPRWKAEAKLAYDWLSNYAKEHFGVEA